MEVAEKSTFTMNEFYDAIQPFVDDMTYFYSLLQAEIFRELDNSIEEGELPEHFINRMDNLLNE